MLHIRFNQQNKGISSSCVVKTKRNVAMAPAWLLWYLVGKMCYRYSEVEHLVEQLRVSDGAERAADAVLLLVQVSGAVQLQEARECGCVRVLQHRAVAR